MPGNPFQRMGIYLSIIIPSSVTRFIIFLLVLGCNYLTLSNQLGEGCAPYARFSLHTSTDIHRLVHVLPALLLYCSSTCRIGSLGFTKYPIHQQIPYPHSNLQISKVTTPLSSHFIFSLSMAGDRIPRTVGLGAA